MDNKKLKLNLGCGDHVLEGYTNHDIKTGMQAYPLIAIDNTFDEIRASHLLEHFPFEQTADVLADWVSKLKPGGTLQIAVPDFGKIVERYKQGDTSTLEQYLLGSHVDENDFHHAIFDYGKLMDMMQNAGLINISRWQSKFKDSASLDISLNLQGEKPFGPQERTPVEVIDELAKDGDFDQKNTGNSGDVKDSGRIKYGDWESEAVKTKRAELDKLAAADKPIKIQAVMSMPRLAFTENMFSAMSAFHPLGINVERATGAFWSQGLTRMMERFTNEGFDYLIAIDFDTYYTIEQVKRLCELAVSNPDVDCIVSLQAKREEDVMLMGWNAPDGMDASDFLKNEIATKELIEIVTGHFGLTIIRCDALKTIAKPWFLAKPGPDGSWNEGRIDSDISFWHNMKRCGKKVCLAPGIQIGHLQQMVTFPGTIENGLHPEHHYMTDINKDGLPEHCKIVDNKITIVQSLEPK